MKLWSVLKGKKTYIVGACLIIAGVLNDWNMEMILQGAGFMAMRAAL